MLYRTKNKPTWCTFIKKNKLQSLTRTVLHYKESFTLNKGVTQQFTFFEFYTKMPKAYIFMAPLQFV